jgi:glycosyltransferase involved in cell wall biosynthesis
VEDRPESTLPITVVIPAYNRARLLERALQSVGSQHPRRPAQVIVVDDHSTDDTPEVAKAYGAELIRHERNLGGNAAARDTGLRAARHTWVALLDDDDEWLPHHLATLWPLTRGSVLVACSCVESSPGSTEHGFHGPLGERPMVLESPTPLLHPENLIPASAAMVHRDIALAVGGFRGVLAEPAPASNGDGANGISILGCEDLDMWCRLLSLGKATLSPRVGVLYHTHNGQISGDWEAMHSAHLKVARSFEDEGWWSRGLIDRREGVTAWDRFREGRRTGANGAGWRLARELLERPRRALGVLDVWRHRAAVRRRTSRLAPSGEPSVAVLSGVDPALVPERDRYEVDLSRTSTLKAFLRLVRHPSSAAMVSSRRQAALIRLAGVKTITSLDPSAHGAI